MQSNTARTGTLSLSKKTLNSGKLPDIIISDVNMPDGDGFHLCSEIKKSERLRHMYFDVEESVTSSYGSQEEGFIIQLNRIISEHLDAPGLDQQLICREMGLSGASLFNKMKAITGTGTKEYITHIRVEKAKTLIETTNLTIAEISEKTRFSSQSYFSTAFKNITGKPPTQYKKNYN